MEYLYSMHTHTHTHTHTQTHTFYRVAIRSFSEKKRLACTSARYKSVIRYKPHGYLRYTPPVALSKIALVLHSDTASFQQIPQRVAVWHVPNISSMKIFTLYSSLGPLSHALRNGDVFCSACVGHLPTAAHCDLDVPPPDKLLESNNSLSPHSKQTLL